MKHWLQITICLMLLSSCSFDGMFLFPYKLTDETKISRYSITIEDTINVTFSKTQPVFTDSKNKIVESEYAISTVNFLNRSSDTINAWLLEPKRIVWLDGFR